MAGCRRHGRPRRQLSADALTEADFHRLTAHDVTGTPLERAFRHGARADRLAWVFCAGYQAALAACFPEFDGPGWSCLAASVRDGAEPCCLTRDDAGLRLDGEKSWIAAVDHVDRLVVAVDDGDDRAFIHVDRTAPGLTLENPGQASFLAELGQGRARFEGVRPGDDAAHLDAQGPRSFRAAEALYVLAALGARLDDALAMEIAAGLEGALGDRERRRRGLAELGARVRAAADAFEAADAEEATAFARSLRSDAKLLALYAPAR